MDSDTVTHFRVQSRYIENDRVNLWFDVLNYNSSAAEEFKTAEKAFQFMTDRAGDIFNEYRVVQVTTTVIEVPTP
jgi:hypothetical protein